MQFNNIPPGRFISEILLVETNLLQYMPMTFEIFVIDISRR